MPSSPFAFAHTLIAFTPTFIFQSFILLSSTCSLTKLSLSSRLLSPQHLPFLRLSCMLFAFRLPELSALSDECYHPCRDNQQQVSDTKLTPSTFHFQDLVPISNYGGSNTQGIGPVRHEQRAPGLEEREELESREPQPIKAGTV